MMAIAMYYNLRLQSDVAPVVIRPTCS